ncbi:MAG: hypothetical protein Q9164_001858 [Protoblastenia rupestris]
MSNKGVEWQLNTGHALGLGNGWYSGAVNQKLFDGKLNSQDACYNNNGKPNWRSNNGKTGPATNDYGCDIHFDIDTSLIDIPNTPGPLSKQGNQWASSGDVIQYRPISCPSQMTDQFKKDCNNCGSSMKPLVRYANKLRAPIFDLAWIIRLTTITEINQENEKNELESA